MTEESRMSADDMILDGLLGQARPTAAPRAVQKQAKAGRGPRAAGRPAKADPRKDEVVNVTVPLTRAERRRLKAIASELEDELRDGAYYMNSFVRDCIRAYERSDGFREALVEAHRDAG